MSAPTRRRSAAEPPSNARGTLADLVAVWRKYDGEPVASDAIYTPLREAILDGVIPDQLNLVNGPGP